MSRPPRNRRRWQFGLGSLFFLTTLAAVVMALLTQGMLWWILAGLVFGNALLFAVIVGLYDVEDR